MVGLREYEGPLYLFGAGGAAYWVTQGFRRTGLGFSGYLDDRAHELSMVAGTEVFTPNDQRIPLGERGDATVVLCVMNPAVDLAAIRERLAGHGWGKVMTFSEFGLHALATTGLHVGMLDPGDLVGVDEEIDRARSLLTDDDSRRLFDAFLHFVRTFDEAELPKVAPDPYYPRDLPRWAENLRMIDLGAFDGDSARAAMQNEYRLEAYAGFEPDPESFSRLSAFTRGLPNGMSLPLGALDTTRCVRFSAQGLAGSAVSNAGEIVIQCAALDDVLPHFKPNFIKLDIEGSEEAALTGASSMLSASRPGLAVSVYHRGTDIWRIPLLLDELVGPARYWLRRHGGTVADTVLYVHPSVARKDADNR